MNKTDVSLALLNLHYWQGDTEEVWNADSKPFLMVLQAVKKIKQGKKWKRKFLERSVKKEVYGEAQIEFRCHK